MEQNIPDMVEAFKESNRKLTEKIEELQQVHEQQEIIIKVLQKEYMQMDLELNGKEQ